MKKLLTTLAVVFLCAKMHPQAISAPQLNVSGNVGCVGFPCLNSGALNFSADANQTMTALQTSANGGVKITSSVSLTAIRTLTVPSGNFQFLDIENATTGGQIITICSAAGGSCVSIPNGTTAVGVWYDGSNFVMGSTGGGGSMVYPGAGIGNSTGSAWGTSYSAGNQIPANFISTLNQNTTGNAATATTLAANPSQCSGAQYAQGVAANGNANCATPTGSGIPTTPTNALVKINGSAGAASSVTDNGTTVSTTESLSAAGGITAGPDGTHAGIMALYGNTANPTIPANEFGWLGFNTTSATAYFLQPSTTAPVGPAVMEASTPSGNVSQVTYSSTLGTVNGVSFPVNGTINIPTTCGGNTSPCYLQQINPTTGATTTTTSTMTTVQTTIPVASGTGFTFAPGNYVQINTNGSPEWVACTGYSSPNLTGCSRAQNGSTATAWASGANVIQVTSWYATSLTTAPYFYALANGAIGYNGAGNNVANTTVFGAATTFLNGITSTGTAAHFVQTPTTLYAQALDTDPPSALGANCGASGILNNQASGSYSWFTGGINQYCNVGTNLVPAGAYVFVTGTTAAAPGAGSTPQGWMTQGGVMTALTGFALESGGSSSNCFHTDGSNGTCSSGGSGITALTGDVTASGTGSVAATVKGINGTILSSLATGPILNTTGTGVPTVGTPTPSSSIFHIASSCNGQTNCLAWVDDDSTDNCGTATTAFMAAVNAYNGPGEAHVIIEGSGSGKAYRLTSCNLAFVGPSGTAGMTGSVSITSNATIDCNQTTGNCIQMGKTGCPTNSYYVANGCHDVTWRGGTFVGGATLTTALMEVESGMFINIIDDVTFNNTGAGNATIGSCTNYTVQWDTYIGGQEFSRNKYYGTVKGQCFSNNNDVTGGNNTIIFTNNVISHAGGATTCGSQAHYDSSAHSIIANNTIYGFSSTLTLASNGTGGGAFLGDGGWMITDNNFDYAIACGGTNNAEIHFAGSTNNVGAVTLNNNNFQSIPAIAQQTGSTAQMYGWTITGNNTYVQNSYLIGGSSTACLPLYGVSCYIGANPGFVTGTLAGTPYVGFTVLGSGGTWPPNAAGPTFSPAAGSISPQTVTTSCPSGGTPYISAAAGTTAVAGATGVAVSTATTLYGSCQGSGYFSTAFANYTVPFSIVNSKYLSGVATPATSAALPSFSAALTPGSLIIVHEYAVVVGSFTVPTDTAGNTYVDCGPGAAPFGATTDLSECFYALNTHSTASNVVTIHSTSSATYLSALAFELLGAPASSPIDGGALVGFSSKNNATGGAAGSNNLTGTTITPAGNGDLIVAFFASGSGNTAGTSPNAFTLVNGSWIQGSEYFTQTTAAAISATASSAASSDPYAAIVIAVKP